MRQEAHLILRILLASGMSACGAESTEEHLGSGGMDAGEGGRMHGGQDTDGPEAPDAGCVGRPAECPRGPALRWEVSCREGPNGRAASSVAVDVDGTWWVATVSDGGGGPAEVYANRAGAWVNESEGLPDTNGYELQTDENGRVVVIGGGWASRREGGEWRTLLDAREESCLGAMRVSFYKSGTYEMVFGVCPYYPWAGGRVLGTDHVERAPGTIPVGAVLMRSPEDIFTFDFYGRGGIARFSGSDLSDARNWSREALPEGIDSAAYEFRAVARPNSQDLLVVGKGGLILRWTAASGAWRQEESGVRVNLRGAWGNIWVGEFVVGEDGTILFYDRSGSSPEWRQMGRVTDTKFTGIHGNVWGTIALSADDGTVCELLL